MWRNERTPYLVGIMDAFAEPGVEEIVFLKATQIGGSEALRNLLGFWIDNDPGPCMVVMPDEKSAEEAVKERIVPMLNASPALTRHVSRDKANNKKTALHLDTMSVYIGWSGSAQSLASRPCRYVLFDEVDKYAAFAGDEADPISLGTERTKTFLHRKRIGKISTPTTRDGNICKAFEACGDKRFYNVPCPHCQEYQRLLWQNCKYPKLPEPDKSKRADTISTQRLAWYECSKCKGRIEDRHKPAMLLKGVWLSEGHQTIDRDGNVTGDRPITKRVGFHLNSLYSPWVTFSDMAAKWILAESDPGATMNFRNSWLAEPDEQVQTKVRPSLVRDKIAGAAPSLKIPSWASAVFACADTQKDHFYFSIRAWGYGLRSQLIHHGSAQSFEELYRVCLESKFQTDSGLQVSPNAMLIDSGGNRTDEVYQFAAKDPGRIFPCKGASHQMRRPWTLSKVGSAGVNLYLLDTGYFKDMLARLMVGRIESDGVSVEQWAVNSETSEDYCLQMANEHKVIDRKSGRMVWQLTSQGAPNHFWDCETLQCAAADMANIAVTPTQANRDESTRNESGGDNWVTAHKGRW